MVKEIRNYVCSKTPRTEYREEHADNGAPPAGGPRLPNWCQALLPLTPIKAID